MKDYKYTHHNKNTGERIRIQRIEFFLTEAEMVEIAKFAHQDKKTLRTWLTDKALNGIYKALEAYQEYERVENELAERNNSNNPGE